MKTLSLVDFIELDVNGSVLKEALCLQDCDNDGFQELVVGNTEGELYIFKDKFCVGRCSGLGSITALSVGDILNIKENAIVVVTAEGWCHLFLIGSDVLKTHPEKCSSHNSIHPFHSQRIVCNIKIILLGDVNGDGYIEMVVGLTDRVLRTYCWKAEETANPDCFEGRFHAINKWEFADQIGNITLTKSTTGESSILLSHPSGNVSKITETNQLNRAEYTEDWTVAVGSKSLEFNRDNAFQGKKSNRPSEQTTPKRNASEPNTILSDSHVNESVTLRDFNLEGVTPRTPNLSTEITGNIFIGDDALYCVSTVDGSIYLCREGAIEWEYKVDHPILCVKNYNGKLMFVGWEGQTYLIEKSYNGKDKYEIKKFHFLESVAAFSVGSYTLEEEEVPGSYVQKSKSCFVFVTFDNKIYIYPCLYF